MIKSLKSKFQKAFSVSHPTAPSFMQYLPAAGTGEMRRAVGDGSRSSVVMAPLQWIMRTFPEAPLVVDRRMDGSWEADEEHPLAQLVERPNPFWSGELLWQVTVMERALTGNAYWIKVTDRQLRVEQLWWAPASTMEPKWPRGGSEFISHYEYSPGGGATKVDLDPSEVVHFRWGVDPSNVRLGLSPLASALREVYADDEAALFSASMLKNMGVPGLILAPDGDAVIGDTEMRAAKKKLMEATTGRKRGEPFIAGAPTKLMQFGFNPQQMDLRTLRRLPEERTSAVLGVPAIVAGLGAGLDRSTFANMAEAREMGWEEAIIPTQRMMASDLKAQLLVDFEPDLSQVRCRFDLSEVRVLQEDENKVTDRKLKELTSGAILLSEYRRETNREAGPEHEVYLRPFSVMEVPASGQLAWDEEKEEERAQALADAPPPPPPPGDEADDPEEGASSPRPPGLRSRKAKAGTRQQQAYMRELQRRERRLAGLYTEELIDEFRKLGDQMAEAYLSIQGAKAQESDEELVGRIMAAAGSGLTQGIRLRPGAERHYARVASDTVEALNATMGLGVNLPDERMRSVIARGGTRAGLVDLDGSTREALFRAIREGRELGEGPPALARRIRSYVPSGRFPNAGPIYRSQLIARTETKYAQNVASIEAAKEASGVNAMLAFDAQGPGESDPDCEARNGQVFTFAQAEVELEDEHPNGTLSFAPVIE